MGNGMLVVGAVLRWLSSPPALFTLSLLQHEDGDSRRERGAGVLL